MRLDDDRSGDYCACGHHEGDHASFEGEFHQCTVCDCVKWDWRFNVEAVSLAGTAAYQVKDLWSGKVTAKGTSIENAEAQILAIVRREG